MEIRPTLAGAEHAFVFKGKSISFKLPRHPKIVDWHDPNSAITCWGYRKRAGRKIPSSYSIHDIQATLNTGRRKSIREDAIGRVDVSLFSTRERLQFDRIANANVELLNQAFDYWLDVIRWVSGIRTIGQIVTNRRRSSWGAYLAERHTMQKFYSPARIIKVTRPAMLEGKHWRRASQLLALQCNVPIWQQYLSESEQKLKIGDVKGCVLDAAIAVETLTRHLTSTAILRSHTPTAENLINAVPISRVLDKWRQLGFKSKLWLNPEGFKDLRNLFDIRNALMHRGKRPEPKTNEIFEVLNSVKWFVNIGERHLERGNT